MNVTSIMNSVTITNVSDIGNTTNSSRNVVSVFQFSSLVQGECRNTRHMSFHSFYIFFTGCRLVC